MRPLPRKPTHVRHPCHHASRAIRHALQTRRLAGVSEVQPLRWRMIGVVTVSGHWRRPAHAASRMVLTGPSWEDYFTLLSALRTDAAATAVAFMPRRKGEVTLLAIGDANGDLLLATMAGVVLAEWPSGTSSR